MSRVGLGLVKKPKKDITVDSLQKLFPSKKSTITQMTVEMFKECMEDPEFDGYQLMDTMTNYQNVMVKNSLSMSQYLDAIRFSAYLESTDDNYIDAYKKTFGHRKFVQDRRSASTDTGMYKELASAASRFRKSPTVVDILTQADVPLYLMFQGQRAKMAMVLANEAVSSKFAKDRISAADKFLTHVKPPENMKIALDVGINQGSVIDDYEKVMRAMVEKQKELIEAGGDLKAITNASIKVSDEVIDAEVETDG